MLKIVIMALLLSVPGKTAQAEDTIEVQPSTNVGPTKPVTVNGETGIWFPLDAAKRIMGDLIKCKSISELHITIQEQMQLQAEESKALHEKLLILEEETASWKNLSALQAAELEQRKSPPWWKNQYLWGAAGLLIGIGATTGIIHAVK